MSSRRGSSTATTSSINSGLPSAGPSVMAGWSRIDPPTYRDEKARLLVSGCSAWRRRRPCNLFCQPAGRLYGVRWTCRQVSTAKRRCSFCSFGRKYRVAFGHRDDLGLLDSIRVAVGHDRRRPAGKHVLHPISAFAIRQGDQKAVVVFGRNDRCLVVPTRTASNMTHDRGAGAFRPG